MAQLLDKATHFLVSKMDALPIRSALYQDEAGLSFIFRTLNANGLQLSEAQHWLSVGKLAPMNHSELQLWAWATGIEHSRLYERVTVIRRDRGEIRYALSGHQFGVGGTAAHHSARLCPQCLKQWRFHRLSWQLACIPGCAAHDRVLIDRCPHCERVISWSRPAMDICTCGHFLTSKDCAQHLPPLLIPWIRWIKDRLANKDGFIDPRDFGLPELFGALSIDGATRVAVAAGLLPDSNSSSGAASKLSRTSAGMAEIISRGINRLTVIGRDFSNLTILHPVLHIPGIERMRAQAISHADETMAEILLGVLGFLSKDSISGSVSSRSRQKSLF